ncbi:tRNA pseudouridine(55) synthase TruB [Clostridium tunisiense]|uniref:tRNA pseudouridine(55) synthase TruB n=1 Tax=Clostridium tunisiense TaxID=219748 RepID=UPI0002E8E436|nr:tRNA pseudouridine(55) synthase TruB [Clostridium tunisiense]
MTLDNIKPQSSKELCGIINVYKPTGITSFDVVRKIKKIARQKKVGHCGTLDPEASGVLPVCLGRATKAIEFIMDDFKIYEAELKLGVVTDTYDREGKIIEEKNVNLQSEEVIAAINSFVGEIEQIPPMYSALKHNGQKLYELARQGIEIEREPRKITIYSIDIVEIKIPIVKILVKCSKGTYIRSLCYDIGSALGCGAMMWSLERHGTGSFVKEDSINIDQLNEENIKDFLLPIESTFENYHRIIVDEKFQKLLVNGVAVKDNKLVKDLNKSVYYTIFNEENTFIGIAYYSDIGLKLLKVFV